MCWNQCRLLIVTAIVCSAASAVAEEVDLTQVDRSIRKEPVWGSGEPQYCLFVILKGDAWGSVSVSEAGERQVDVAVAVANAQRRIWFVVDGNDLYMDINENGDLTDPGEKLPLLEVSDEQRRRFTNYSHWRIPDIKGTDGKPLITNIQINLNTGSGAAFGAKYVRFSSPYCGRRSTPPTFARPPPNARSCMSLDRTTELGGQTV